jgi:hypothetical protein
MMGQLLKHAPKLIALAAKLPGLIAGYVAAWILFVVFIGPAGMKEWTGGSFGPDIVALFLVPVALRWVQQALSARAAAAQEHKRGDSIAAEAKLALQQPLD